MKHLLLLLFGGIVIVLNSLACASCIVDGEAFLSLKFFVYSLVGAAICWINAEKYANS